MSHSFVDAALAAATKDDQVDAALYVAMAQMRWQRGLRLYGPTFHLGGLIGKHAYDPYASSLRLHRHFAASREMAGFTAADDDADRNWPAFTLAVAVPAGAEGLRNELAVRVAKVVSEFLAEHKLDRELPTQTKGDTE